MCCQVFSRNECPGEQLSVYLTGGMEWCKHENSRLTFKLRAHAKRSRRAQA